MKDKIAAFFRKPFFSDYRTLLGLWVLVAIIASVQKLFVPNNNYMMYQAVFWHVWNQVSLFAHYPLEYADVNHYGPFFGLVIGPYAILPYYIGRPLWLLTEALVLWFAIRKLPLRQSQHIFIYWFCAHELLTALYRSQFNVSIAALIVATFYCIEKRRDFWAALFIMIGTFVKLYGIVGLAFFFFSKNKGQFILGLLFWAVIMFCAPMLISSPEYVIGQYQEWYVCLQGKNMENLFSLQQNVSVLGMVRKISGCASYSDIWVLLPALALFAAPYLRFSQYKNPAFRYTLLASVLMFVVLFSTGSESSGYITAFVGVSLWHLVAPWQRSKWDIALLIFAFILTSLSPSDLFPRWLREHYVYPYALKALPVALIWFKLVWEMLTRNYSKESMIR